ncbi:hypothetical protein M9434_000437 [Picochlorum sp. BPE23]|nr:hypothetical protein M9434_000437 [Picochlorum sp. BPE23]
MLKQGGSEVNAVLVRGLEGPVEIADVATEPPFPASATAATIVSATPKTGSENDTLVVTWVPGDDSVPPAGDPAFYVTCVANGSACPKDLNFDLYRPSGSNETTVVSGLMEGTLYDCYMVAKDWDGTGVCSEPAQVSTYQRVTAPAIASAEPKPGAETDTLMVTWVPGDDSVPPAGDPAFYVACVPGGSPCPSSPTFDVDRPLGVDEITDVAGLTEGTLYDCYVVAKDWDGTGVCSEPAQVSTYQRVTAPAIASAEPKPGAETDTLMVTWVPGDDSVPPAGDPAFYVACVPGGSPCPSSPTFDVDRPLGVDEITDVAGLTEGTLYDCYVVAKDWDGTGVCSEPAQVSTYQRVTAPAIVSAEPKPGAEMDTLMVTWVPGDDSVPPAGDPAFYVACVPGGSPCPSSPTFDVDRPLGVDEITDVVGLTEGTLYDCYVVAKDSDGTGVCSEPAQVSTYQRITAPEILFVEPKPGAETDTLVVIWVPGDDSVPPAGDPAFYVACVPGGSPCPSSPTFDVDRPLGVDEITDVVGLTEGTLYDCYVVAKDWDGTGVCSEPAQVSTYQRVTAPAIVSAEPKPGAETDTLMVTWVPGDDSVPPAGDPAFYVACVPGGSPCPSSPTFDVDRPLGVDEITDVAGLTEGTLYDCYVVAKDWDGTGVCSEPAQVSTYQRITAPAIVSAEPKPGAETDTLMVIWVPGDDSVPPAGDPAFYVACVPGGSPCPSSPTFDVDRPLGVDEITDVAGLTEATLYDCYVVAKDSDGTGVCSEPAQVSTYQRITAPEILFVEPKPGAETDTLVVIWVPGDDSVPPAGDPAFYVACVPGGSPCPSSPTFDVDRPLGVEGITDVAGLTEATLYDCYVVAKDWDGTAVCSEPASTITLCDVSLNYEAIPVNGKCVCKPGFIDLNGDPSDGCEYEQTCTIGDGNPVFYQDCDYLTSTWQPFCLTEGTYDVSTRVADMSSMQVGNGYRVSFKYNPDSQTCVAYSLPGGTSSIPCFTDVTCYGPEGSSVRDINDAVTQVTVIKYA